MQDVESTANLINPGVTRWGRPFAQRARTCTAQNANCGARTMVTHVSTHTTHIAAPVVTLSIHFSLTVRAPIFVEQLAKYYVSKERKNFVMMLQISAHWNASRGAKTTGANVLLVIVNIVVMALFLPIRCAWNIAVKVMGHGVIKKNYHTA